MLDLDPASWRPRPPFHSQGSSLLYEAEELWSKRARDPTACDQALDRLRRCLQYGLDTPESLRRAELLGRIYMWFDDQTEALRWFDEALHFATILHVQMAIRRVQLKRATNFHYLLQCHAGCETLEPMLLDLQDADDAHRTDGARVEPDIQFEVDCRLRIARLRFFLADFGLAARQLERAWVLLGEQPRLYAAQATHANLVANLQFWQDHPLRAVEWGMRAIEWYRRAEQQDSEGRTEVLVAQALVAHAVLQPEGTTRDLHLFDAGIHVARARQIARLLADRDFDRLVLLAQAAREGALGDWTAATSHIMRVLDHATSPVVLAQAWSILGAIQHKLGAIEASNTSYRSALIVLEHTELPAFGEQARQALMKST